MISGKEAKLAWANSEDVEVRVKQVWFSINEMKGFRLIDFDDKFSRFRIKPRTITLNGIEVPAPISDMDSLVSEYSNIENFFVYHLDSSNPILGYSGIRVSRLQKDVVLGWSKVLLWRTEEEIKQVVSALCAVSKES